MVYKHGWRCFQELWSPKALEKEKSTSMLMEYVLKRGV
jgi:hypothetical protein